MEMEAGSSVGESCFQRGVPPPQETLRLLTLQSCVLFLSHPGYLPTGGIQNLNDKIIVCLLGVPPPRMCFFVCLRSLALPSLSVVNLAAKFKMDTFTPPEYQLYFVCCVWVFLFKFSNQIFLKGKTKRKQKRKNHAYLSYAGITDLAKRWVIWLTQRCFISESKAWNHYLATLTVSTG